MTPPVRPALRPARPARSSVRPAAAAAIIVALLTTLLSFATVTSASAPAAAQGPVELSADHLNYLGAFRFPDPDSWAYSGHAMTFLPQGAGAATTSAGSLVVSGHVHDRDVGEISIPTPVISSNWYSLPEAQVLRGLTDITGGRIPSCTSGGGCLLEVGGLQYLPNVNRIAWSWRDWYNIGAIDYDSHGWSRVNLTGAEGTWHVGPRGTQFHNAKTNDYMFSAPDSFAATHLSGRTLITGNHRPGGTFFGSQGPSMIATAPWNDSRFDGATLGATKLIDYPEIPACLGNPDRCEFDDYRPSDAWGGGVWVETDEVEGVVFVGRKGIGYTCYGTPGDPFDPGDGLPGVPGCIDKSTDPSVICTAPTQGWHSGPYAPMMAFYSASDLAEVANGRLAPNEIETTSRHVVTETFDDDCGLLLSAAFDRSSGRIYVAENGAGPYGRTAVHVWEVDGNPTAPGPTPTAVPPTPTAVPPTPPPSDGTNLLTNGTFDRGTRRWWANGTVGAPTVESGTYCATSPATANRPAKTQVGQGRIALEAGANYRLAFDIAANASATIQANVQIPSPPFRAPLRRRVDVTSTMQRHTFDFSIDTDVPNAVVIFKLGTGERRRICLDNVSLTKVVDSGTRVHLLRNRSFNNGLNNWYDSTGEATVTNGTACLRVPAGTTDRRDVELGQAGFALRAGNTYRASVEMRANRATGAWLMVEETGGSFTEYVAREIPITTTTRRTSFVFTMDTNEDNALAILKFGDGRPASTVCIERFTLVDLG